MVLATFPDVPEAVACGESEDEAVARARSVLDVILRRYASEGKALPQPSDICGAPTVASSDFSR